MLKTNNNNDNNNNNSNNNNNKIECVIENNFVKIL